MTDAGDIVVNNGKRDLTLDELARSSPGMAQLMALIAERARRLYFAGSVGNWPLAGYFVRTLGKELEAAAFSRPKYAEGMREFLGGELRAVREAIHAESQPAFAAAWDAMVTRVNHWHVEYGYEYIAYRTPDLPPPDLDLTPWRG